MWKIKLPREQDIAVTKEEAEFVKEQLKTGTDDFIEVAGQIIKRSQVMAIISEEGSGADKELSRERAEANEQWKEGEGRLTLQDPETKAEREINCKVKLLYFCRTHSFDIPKELCDKIRVKLIEFFKANPKEGWASPEVYRSLMPPSMAEKNRGLQSVREIIKGRV